MLIYAGIPHNTQDGGHDCPPTCQVSLKLIKIKELMANFLTRVRVPVHCLYFSGHFIASHFTLKFQGK